ncbi:hypothetical protein ACFL6Y_02215 [Elusimicrobiota bacterium]
MKLRISAVLCILSALMLFTVGAGVCGQNDCILGFFEYDAAGFPKYFILNKKRKLETGAYIHLEATCHEDGHCIPAAVIFERVDPKTGALYQTEWAAIPYHLGCHKQWNYEKPECVLYQAFAFRFHRRDIREYAEPVHATYSEKHNFILTNERLLRENGWKLSSDIDGLLVWHNTEYLRYDNIHILYALTRLLKGMECTQWGCKHAYILANLDILKKNGWTVSNSRRFNDIEICNANGLEEDNVNSIYELVLALKNQGSQGKANERSALPRGTDSGCR